MACEICDLIATLHLHPKCHALFTCTNQQAFANYYVELSGRISTTLSTGVIAHFGNGSASGSRAITANAV